MTESTHSLPERRELLAQMLGDVNDVIQRAKMSNDTDALLKAIDLKLTITHQINN